MATLSINKVYQEALKRRSNPFTPSLAPEEKLNQMLDPIGSFGLALYEALEDVGERFRLYDIMAQSGPVTPACLATQAGITEQSTRIWLDAQAAENYLHHDVSTNLYCLWCNWSPGRSKGPRQENAPEDES
jgi:hypothetical protein